MPSEGMPIEAKLELLKEALRTGNVGPHKFDHEFGELWTAKLTKGASTVAEPRSSPTTKA